MSNEFHPLRVVEVASETTEAVTLTLAPEPDRADAFAFAAGQHLTLRAIVAGEELRRNYSLCVPPSAGRLQVAIKKVDGGRFSHWAASSLKAGDVVDAMPPRGHFTWTFEAGRRRNYVAFAGGSGITPILSLIWTGLEAEPDSRFTLLYGNRHSGTVMFLEQLAALKDRHLARFRIYHFLDDEFDDIDLFNGRLDEERVGRVLTSLVDPGSIDAAFVCGPGPMMDAAERAMVAAGVERDRILVERFSTAPPSAALAAAAREAGRQAEGARIRITLDGRRRTVAFSAEAGSILESARIAGLPAPYACKAGVCATCRAKLVEGSVQMLANYGLSSEEIAAGYILTCQAVPKSSDVAVDYDA